MFEPFQIGQEFREWQALKRADICYPLRFGQWFMNRHKLEGHQKLFYEPDPQKALLYIQQNLMNSAFKQMRQ